MHKLNILICDDMEHVRILHEHKIQQCAGAVFKPLIETAETPEGAIQLVKEAAKLGSPFDIILLDIDFSQTASKLNGFDVATVIQKYSPATVIVIVSSHSTQSNMSLVEQSSIFHKFLRRGEYTDVELFEACIFALVRKLHARGELLSPKDTTFSKAAVMESCLIQVDQVGPEQNVIIYGETGTGKELAARRINANAKVALNQAIRPLVTINCGGLTDTLKNSELFGYVRGAFTGANQDTPGLLEQAEGGDAFLDELQNMPIPLQEALLLVLNNKEFTPVGGKKSKKLTNVRFITALNKDPTEIEKSGVLKSDLFARLQGNYIMIPPLRSRDGDIAPLIEHFMGLSSKADKRFSSEAVSFLESMQWTTNVRGLHNLVLEAIRQTKIPVISVEALKRLPSIQKMECEAVQSKTAGEPSSSLDSMIEPLVMNCLDNGVGLEEAQRKFEEKILTRAWDEIQNVARVARRLQLPESTVRRKLIEYGIRKNQAIPMT